ncbi:hypothetical protein [Evansella cellulosilytica]|uniref:Uncharacterized protein n=1 Tax=Evansella cellulosilytica (strain ATCC 21833 / DSM 2522 / FERM P-1141 / JCM 9156 / N-4) TaxID=649639 RepID=E6TY28_EVAC2|nr:hypothetical protein [Evansella cellulosilytica]ADU31241.1 hypothetical protein Bcell_2991 [Evansella cellulosilytica DSM 2522]
MKRVFLSACFAFTVLLVACSNEQTNGAVDYLEDTDDIETLIERNQSLAAQVTNLQEENEQLSSQMENLSSENIELKDDIFNYRQQLLELRDEIEETVSVRNDLDELAADIFIAMDEENHIYLERVVGDNITVNRAESQLLINDSNSFVYSFPYISMDTINYVRQSEYDYNKDENIFTAKYLIYQSANKAQFQEVTLTFEYDENWKLVAAIMR